MTASLVFPSINSRNDANIVLSFSDVVDSTTLTGRLTIDGSTSGAHVFTGISGNSSVYSLDPTVNFANSETVTVTLSTGITNFDGSKNLRMATTATTTVFNFTVAATTTGQPSEDPYIITGSQYPAPGSTVSINEDRIYVAFSKEVMNVSGNYTITGSTSGALEGIAVATDVNLDGLVWELPISGSPVYGETITVELTAGITDTFLAPITLVTWDFDIEAAPTTFDPFEIYPTSVRVTNVTENSAIIRWTTNAPVLDTDARVNYAEDTGYVNSEDEGATGTESFTVHAVTLTGLASGKKHYYQVYSENAAAASDTYIGTFITDFGAADTSDPVSTTGNNKSGITLVQNTDNGGTPNGSSYAVWLNGLDAYAFFFDTDASIPWGLDGEVIDSNGSSTAVTAIRDGFGSMIVAMNDASNNIRAKMVSDNAGTIEYADIWHGGATAWGNSAASAGNSIGTGTNVSMAVVWGGLGNNNADGDFITPLTSGDIEMDIPANPFYDFDSDLMTGITASDLLINTGTHGIVTATPSTNFRHVSGQSSSIISATNNYAIGDISTTDPLVSAIDHLINNMGNPATLYRDDANPTAGLPVEVNVYTAHGYNPDKGTWQVDAGDILYDGTSIYRIISAVTEIDFATANTTEYTGNSNDAFNPTLLKDALADFITDGVAAGDLVIRTDLTDYATVTAVVSATELELSDQIFTATGQPYTIYPEIRSGISNNSWFEESQVDDGTDFQSGTPAITGGGVGVGDLVRDSNGNTLANDDDYAYVDTVDNETQLTLTAAIMESSIGGTNNTYFIYQTSAAAISSGNTGAFPTSRLYDAAATFITDGTVASGDIIENISLTSYAFIDSIASETEIDAATTGFFTASGQNYQIHTGRYCDTHFGATMFTSYYEITVDSDINANLSTFTIYNTLVSGTADAEPTNPLYDDDANFTAIPVQDNDVAVNVTAGSTAVSLVDSIGFTMRARAIGMDDNIMNDGDSYYLLRFIDPAEYVNITQIGTSTGDALNTLIDTNGTFATATDEVKKGDIIYNLTDNRYAVAATDSSIDNEVELNKDIFDTGEDYIIIRSDIPVIETGVNTGTGATLTDTSAAFTSANAPVTPGDIVHNTTTGDDAVVVTINTGTQLILNSAIMNSGDSYYIAQPRVLFAYQTGGGIYATLVNLRDGSLFDQDNDGDNTNDELTIAAAGTNPHIISDGLGSSFIAYQNAGTIYVRTIDGAGNNLSGTYSIAGTILDVISDNNNGIYLLYQNGGNWGVDRLSVPTASAWGGAVTLAGSDTVLTVCPSGDAIITYVDGSNDIVMTKLVAGSGTVSNSYTIEVGTGDPYTPVYYILSLSITGDENGGAIVSWIDDRYYTNMGLTAFTQTFDTTLTPEQDNDTVSGDYTGLFLNALSTDDNDEAWIRPLYFNDGGTPYGALYLWLDYRNAQADIYYYTLNRP
ncbi:MAG: hypothetical protein CVV44_04860 [Spirochaetae bacterium HGW-Spirochaetae-1]|jgi:hypothetical protein|nr:MAG: hypothetical protein CVV44_04860 [Spirochaetae bacterium HGW-Spirochaetae-1]